MVVPNQGRPFGERLGMPFGLARLALSDPRSSLPPAIRVSSRVEGIGEQRQDIVIDGQLPYHAAIAAISRESREGDLLAAEPQQHLPDASEFGHFAERQMKAFLDPAIGVLLDFAGLRPVEAHGKKKLQLAPASLLTNRLQRSLSQQTQFERRHLSFHAEKQTIIDEVRIVDSIEVHQHRACQAAQPDQVVPVAAVPRQPRRLDAKHGAHFASTDLSDQALQSGALHQAGPRASLVFIDHEDVRKAELACLVGQALLPSLALLILKHLFGGRLPKVNDRPPIQSLIREFRVHSDLLSASACPRSERLRGRATRRERGRVLVVRSEKVPWAHDRARPDSVADSQNADGISCLSSCDGDLTEALSQEEAFCKMVRRSRSSLSASMAIVG